MIEIYCVNGHHIYNYDEKKLRMGGVLTAEDLIPVNNSPQLHDGDIITGCPKCGMPYTRMYNGIQLMTKDGWKP